MVVIPKPEKLDEEAVGCIITFEGKFLLTHKVKDGLWGSVAGSVKEEESPRNAVRRCLEGELRLQATPHNFTTTYHQYGDRKIAYNIYELKLENDPKDIDFNREEISELRLVTLQEALDLNLYEDEGHCLSLFPEHRMG